MNVERRQAAADPQTKPNDLACESTCRLLESTPINHHHHLLLLLFNLKADTYFTVPQRVEGWVDLAGWLHTKMYTYPQMVTHPVTNRVWCSATTLIEANTLPLSQTANQC